MIWVSWGEENRAAPRFQNDLALIRGPDTLALTGVRTFPGFNFKWGQRGMSGLMDSAMICISNFGGGVWHGASNGAEGHADIATPILQPGH